jgi:hypothetical protein
LKKRNAAFKTLPSALRGRQASVLAKPFHLTAQLGRVFASAVVVERVDVIHGRIVERCDAGRDCR